MSAGGQSSERLVDTRYRRFGIILGVVAAVLIHGLFFLIPSSSLPGKKETQRGMVARAIRTRPPVPPPPPDNSPGTRAAEQSPQPKPKAAPEPSRAPVPDTAPVKGEPVAVQSAAAPEAPTGIKTSSDAPGAIISPGPSPNPLGAATSGQLNPGIGGGGGQAGQGQGASGTGTGSGTSQDTGGAKTQDWDKMLAMLDTRRQEIETKKTAEKEATVAKKRAAEKTASQAADKFLDPRIRMSVTSYPPSPIEEKPPPVTYPGVKFTQSQLAAGTCRVYYRVWTDDLGKIRRTEIKTPATATEREKYKMFIDSVVESVAGWSFPPVEAQVHIDVLFEIR